MRLGIIGCGRIVHLVHLKALTRLPGVEVAALAEVDPERLRTASRLAPRAVAFSDYPALLARPDIEAVVICLPNALHAEAAIEALQRGKHVYLEKPLAVNLDEGRRVVAAWRKAGVVGMIGFNYRLSALYQTAREEIRSGRLGPLIGARSVFCSAAPSAAGWRQGRRSGGGAMMDLASHHIDLLHFLFGGRISRLFARIWSQFAEDDCATLQVWLDSGLSAQCFFSLSTVEQDRFEIYGQRGGVVIDRLSLLNMEFLNPSRNCGRLARLRGALGAFLRGPYLWERILKPASEPSYRAALAHFIAAARANRPSRPDLWDGYRSLAVVEAAKRSARTGEVVVVPDVDNEDFAG